jgi:hypothetical protein
MDTFTVLLSTLLTRTILVGSVLLSMKFAWEGLFGLSLSLVAALAFFGYLTFGEGTFMR